MQSVINSTVFELNWHDLFVKMAHAVALYAAASVQTYRIDYDIAIQTLQFDRD